MPRSFVLRRNHFGQSVVCGLAIAALVGSLFMSADAVAQSKKKGAAEPEKKSGKIAEVEKKGKTSTLKVEEADGETFDVLVTSKVNFMVHGTGDSGFLKHPKAFVSSEKVIMANNQYFGKQFTVHLGLPPEAGFEANPDNPEVYRVAGQIVDFDESTFTVNAGGRQCKVNIEQGADLSVAVESTDPEHATVGSEVEVEGTAKNGKFHATAVMVTLGKPLVAEEVFSARDKKVGKSKVAPTKSAKKTSKSDRAEKGDKGDKADGEDKGDEAAPAGEPLKPGADPFNVLDNKTGKKDAKKKTGAGKPKAKKSTDDGDMNN